MSIGTAKFINTDLLVIGGGVAGVFAAIKAKEAGVEKITLVSKGKLGKDSVSTFAAGVYDVFFPEEDDKDKVYETRALKDYWGAGLYDDEWLNILLDESKSILLDMEKWGVEWERTPDGKIQRMPMKRDAVRAMFHGPQMMEALARKVKTSGIEVISHTMMTDLLTENGQPGQRVVGAVGFEARTGEFLVVKAKATVLAAGGCGFKGRFACHKFQTGEATAMAYRAGALLGRFEAEGLHTTPIDYDMHGLNMFQGLGGIWVNGKGEQFLKEYDPELGDHTPMDRMCQAMAMEVRAGRGPIYLDMTHFTPEQVRKMRVVLPIPTTMLQRGGYITGDRVVKKLEWGPALFGTVCSGGGIVNNTKCETSLPGLFACGDAMVRTGNHRSLQGSTVSGARAGRFVAEYVKKAEEPEVDQEQVERLRKFTFSPLERKDGVEPDHIFIGLLEQLIPYEVSVIGRGDRFEKALSEVERIRDHEVPLLFAVDPHCLRLANEARSMVLVAEMYLRSRILRTESRGQCLLREDYPYVDNVNWLKWTTLKQDEGKMNISTVDCPVDRYKVKPIREKYMHEVFEVAIKRGVQWG